MDQIYLLLGNGYVLLRLRLPSIPSSPKHSTGHSEEFPRPPARMADRSLHSGSEVRWIFATIETRRTTGQHTRLHGRRRPGRVRNLALHHRETQGRRRQDQVQVSDDLQTGKKDSSIASTCSSFRFT